MKPLKACVWTLALVLTVCLQSSVAATIEVPAGGDLQAAINRAQPGDTLLLAPGATFTGNFKLPVHPGTTYITIRSAADTALLPPAGSRITPAFAKYLPRLQSPNAIAALRTASGAAYWRLLFVEIATGSNPTGSLIELGDGSAAQSLLSQAPHHLILDRVYLHGDPLNGQKRAISLNTGETTIVNSYVSDIKAVAMDASALAAWNGPGPYRIENNYFEAAGTPILFGGDDAKIVGLSPSDILFRGNVVTRPVSWRDPIVPAPQGLRTMADTGGLLDAGTYAYRVVARRAIAGTTLKSSATAEVAVTTEAGGRVLVQWTAVPEAADYLVYGRTPGGQNRYWIVKGATTFVDDGSTTGTAGSPSAGTVWQVKNLFELKNARHVRADFNLIENNWLQAQAGTAILFTPRNQGGNCTWCTVEDIAFEYNIVRSIAGGIQLLGWDNLHPSQQATNLRIRHNLVTDLSRSWGSNAYFLYVSAGPRDVTVDHNTIVSPNGYGVVMADGAPTTNFVFTNNVARHNSYGIIGSGQGAGNAAIAKYFPGALITRNVLAGGRASLYPAGNEFPTVADFEAHFVDYAAGDYALVPGTTWSQSGTDGLDLGADLSMIRAAREATVIDPPRIETAALPATTEGEAYGAALAASGGLAPYQWSIVDGTLPPGLVLDPFTGAIAGSTTTAGDYAFTVRAFDLAGAANVQPLAIHVNPYIPPPPPDIVIYAGDVATTVGNYQLVADVTAADGFGMWNPDRGAAKVTAASASPADYVEYTFLADADRPYHLWIRARGQKNLWSNDSAFVQFSNVAAARIGTTGSLTFSLEEALNAGISGWGWEDNGWGEIDALGASVVFETGGLQTLRIQPREDGLTFDQIVLSPETYLTTRPGTAKKDGTILSR